MYNNRSQSHFKHIRDDALIHSPPPFHTIQCFDSIMVRSAAFDKYSRTVLAPCFDTI